nr:CAP domain-containing protein [Streptomyces sp. NEAU-HV9]
MPGTRGQARTARGRATPHGGHGEERLRRPHRFERQHPGGQGRDGGLHGWSSLAENVAAGRATAADVVRSWMKSPGHRANILNCSLRHIGVGYVKKADSANRPNWTQDFGAKF